MMRPASGWENKGTWDMPAKTTSWAFGSRDAARRLQIAEPALSQRLLFDRHGMAAEIHDDALVVADCIAVLIIRRRSLMHS